MNGGEDRVMKLLAKLRAEWPAVLAVAVLILGHVYLAGVGGEPIRPIGVPLFAAILVFLAGELVRRLA